MDPEQRILYQVFIAFGCGAGDMRVPRVTCEAIHDHYLQHLKSDKNQKRIHGQDLWGQPEHGAQALARVRATGRLAAMKAAQDGSVAISSEHFASAAATVEARGVKPGYEEPEGCTWCDEPPPSEPVY